MHRHILGIVALLLLLSGILGLMLGFSVNSQAGMAAGVGIRAGLVLGALWMAYPQLMQLLKHAPKWIYGLGVLLAMVVVFGRNSLVFVVPALVILGGLQLVTWFLKPKPRKAARRTTAKAGAPPPPKKAKQ